MGKDIISSHLLDVLATFPSRTRLGRPRRAGEPHLGFDADDVIVEADHRQKTDDEQEETVGIA